MEVVRERGGEGYIYNYVTGKLYYLIILCVGRAVMSSHYKISMIRERERVN